MLTPGKLPPHILSKLLQGLSSADPRLTAGPQVGEDTAVIDNGDTYLLVTSDPITFVTDNIGWYSVVVNINDIAVMGGIPRWFVPVLLLPESCKDEQLAVRIMGDIGRSCSEFGVTVIGGHTEITPGLQKPLVSATMIGEVGKKSYVDKSRIRPGDLIYLAGGIAAEAVTIIAAEKKISVQSKFGGQFYRRALNYLLDPGLCVYPNAQIAAAGAELTSMHDPTEGGLLGGIWELAERAGSGFILEADNVNIYPECKMMCNEFGIDPLRVIASGALLITLRPGRRSGLEQAFASAGVPLSRIGEITDSPESRIVVRNGIEEQIKMPVTDEIYKIWA